MSIIPIYDEDQIEVASCIVAAGVGTPATQAGTTALPLDIYTVLPTMHSG